MSENSDNRNKDIFPQITYEQARAVESAFAQIIRSELEPKPGLNVIDLSTVLNVDSVERDSAYWLSVIEGPAEIEIGSLLKRVHSSEDLTQLFRAVFDALLSDKGPLLHFIVSKRPIRSGELLMAHRKEGPITFEDKKGAGRRLIFANHQPCAMWSHSASLWVLRDRELIADVIRVNMPPVDWELFYTGEKESKSE